MLIPAVKKSIYRRLILTTLPLLAIFLILAGLGLDRAYQRSAIAAEFEKLQLQAWSLMADAEIEQGVVMMPELLQEPQFSAADSDLFGFVSDANNQRQWQSASVLLNDFELTPIVAGLTSIRAGQSDQTRLSSGVFVFRQGVTYVSEQHDKSHLTFIVVELGAHYKQQLGGYRQSLIFWLGLVLAVLLVLQFLALRWGLSPLATLAQELGDLERGKRDSLGDDYPLELLGVTENLNHLLESQNAQQARYRNTLSDLAHSLKTPLAVLQSQLEIANSEGQEDLLAQIKIMDDIVSRQLKRAVIQNPESLSASYQAGTVFIELGPVVERLVNALSTVYRDKNVQLDLSVDNIRCSIDESDLMELLGGILDNSFKYCHTHVSVNACLATASAFNKGISDDRVNIIIEDDGSGIPEAQYAAVLKRGVRLDNGSSGQGIGLTISLDILDAYGGELQIGRSELGGAKLSISLPCLPPL